MITHQQEKYSWKFTFIGADASTFDTAKALGFRYGQTICYAPAKSRVMYDTISQNISSLRAASLNAQVADFCYSDNDREAIK
jgi:hypothetical protein